MSDHIRQSHELTADNLLVLAYYYPPQNESGALRPARFCKYLPRYGYRPIVITAAVGADPATPQPGVIHVPGTGQPRPSVKRMVGLSRIFQRVAPYNDRIEWVPHAVAAASQVLRETGVRVVVSTSPPLATHIAALWIKLRYKIHWIADFRDPLVSNPFRKRFHGRPYDALLERCFVSRADAVIVNTDASMDALSRRYPKFRKKFRLIWNGYDADEDLKPEPIPPRDYKRIVHIGSIYGGRHPGRLISAMNNLLERGLLKPAEIRLRLVGSVDFNMSWIKSAAFSALVERGCLEYSHGAVPRAEARKEMAGADYLLILDVNESGTGLQVPAKLFEYIRIGRPVLAITSRGSPVERILDQSGMLRTCIYMDDTNDEVERKVLAFVSLANDPVVPSSWFQSQFDAVAQTEMLASVISLISRGEVPR
jgi:glycosyltransferase involved in cell wall biosynthesis